MTLAAALMTFGSGDARASSSCAASRACIASTPSLSRSSRTVLPVVRLDVDIRIAPRATEALRRAAGRSSSCRRPSARSTTMWRARSDVIADRRRPAYTRTRGTCLATARRRSRRRPSSASSVAASSGGCSGSAARAMGYRVAVLDPDPVCPAAAVADQVVVGRTTTSRRRCGWPTLSDVVTYELEHVAAGRRGARGGRPGPARARAAARDPGPARRAPVRGGRRDRRRAVARGPVRRRRRGRRPTTLGLPLRLKAADRRL